jgi:hypothetical protein
MENAKVSYLPKYCFCPIVDHWEIRYFFWIIRGSQWFSAGGTTNKKTNRGF